MKIIFVRHGETDRNLQERAKEKIISDDISHHLNARGREQAKEVAERLKNEHIDAILTSPYNRALETADAIAKYHQDTPIIKLDGLKERGGVLVGDLYHESFNFDKASEHIHDSRFKNVEPIADFLKRVYTTIDKIKQYNYETVAIVAHGGVHHAFYAYFNNLEWKGNLRIDKMHNCDIRIYETES